MKPWVNPSSHCSQQGSSLFCLFSSTLIHCPLSHTPFSLLRTISVSVNQLRKTSTPISPWQPPNSAETCPESWNFKGVWASKTFGQTQLHPHKHATLLTFTCIHWHAETNTLYLNFTICWVLVCFVIEKTASGLEKKKWKEKERDGCST